MSRKFIATILAAALTVTGFAATPARANDAEALARILGTAATVYIIGNAIKNSRDDDDRVRVNSNGHRYDRDDRYDRGRYDRDRYDRNRYDRNDRYDHGRDRHRTDRHRTDRGRDWDRRSRGLPTRCLLRGVNRKGDRVSVLGARCVERNFHRVNRLPDRCRVQMRTEKGVRVVYKTRCLRRNGFELARR
ncbi:hypothetical protein ACOXXX_05325 [Thalassococcus sp. BH17M4-6]|uniref:hypothetical protein n=1 Tax=Thalassococcus sp. BH17M4-6 TaxID=3413148 RepID=UPI003BCD338A